MSNVSRPDSPSNPARWTSQAGPRQTKAVETAIGALRWRGKTIVEINDRGRTELVRMTGGDPSEECETAQREIGERFDWTITRENCREIEAALAKATEALTLPEEDRRTTPEERARRDAACAKANGEREEKQRQADESKAAILAKRPPWAAALVVAELNHDDCEIQTDYFNHTTSRRVAIGWRKSKRENFATLRKVAATFPETAHLGPGCDVWYASAKEEDGRHIWLGENGHSSCGGRAEFTTEAEALAFIESHAETFRIWRLTEPEACRESVEHRENYSMGNGNYLKAGSTHDTGWRVRSVLVEHIGGYAYEDCLPDPSKPAEKTQANTKPTAGDGFEIQRHHHDKRGYDFWLVVLAERVDREAFERLRDSCKASGGWYSRAWRGTPGGFGFRQEAEANEWAASIAPIATGEAVPA